MERALSGAADERAPLWYHEIWIVLGATLFVFPVGLVLLARTPRVSPPVRAIVVVSILSFLGAFGLVEYHFGEATESLLDTLGLIHAMRARQRADQGLYDEAISNANIAWKLDPDRASTGATMGASLLKLDKGRQAHAALRAALLGPPSVGQQPAALVLARALLGDPEVMSNPLPPDPDRAEKVLKKLSLAGLLDERNAEVRLVRCDIARARGQPRMASYNASLVIRESMRPLYGPAYRRLAQIEGSSGRIENALRWAAESLRYDPYASASHELYTNLGARADADPVVLEAFKRAIVLQNGQNGFEASRGILETLVRTRDKFILIDLVEYMFATQLYYERSSYEKALALYQKVIDSRPLSKVRLRSLFHAALCYERLGRRREAIEFHERVIKEAPPGHFIAQHAQVNIARMNTLGNWSQDINPGWASKGS